MNKMVVRIVLTVVVIVCVCAILAGCGGGSGSATGIGGYGTLEGNVFVPGGRSGSVVAAAGDRSGLPSGFDPLVGATVTATVKGIDYPGITDWKGHYVILLIPAGSASVRITPPAGSGYREFTTTVNIISKGSTSIGLDGQVSLLTSGARDLTVTADTIDVSEWPSVTAHVSVNDPGAEAAVLGLASGNFTLNLNGGGITVTSVHSELIPGTTPHLGYVLTGTASGSRPSRSTAVLAAYFCGRTGSVTTSVSYTPETSFLAPMSSTTIVHSFKDPNYATSHPGKWHMGTDISASQGTKITATARGLVVGVLQAEEDTGVVVEHRVLVNLNTGGGPTRDIYVLYGCVTPTVIVGDTLEAGQEIGSLRSHSEGSHLHLALCVGESITSAIGDSDLVGGVIPAADGNGLTNGWVDPIAFFAGKMPDNSWNLSR